jgi:nucleotide-binding universal stress UspA family protein
VLPIRTVLHPTDLSQRSEHAFQLACALARDYGARLVVVHVWSMPPPMLGEVVPQPNSGYYPAATEEKLAQLRPPSLSVRVEYRLEEGNAADTILRVANEAKADLIVMGTHGRTGLRRLLMGSIAEQVIRRATCPVVTTRSPFPDAEAGARAVTSRPALEGAGGV